MQQKIKAYTLMEVTVAMLLSAICITMCYSAYQIITSYHKQFGERNEASAALLSLRQVLQKDFLKSNHVIKRDQAITLFSDSATINYVFDTAYITRNFNQLHTDTFKLKSTAFTANFEGELVLEKDTIDQITLNVILPKNIMVPIQIHKIYSSQNLLN